MQPDRKFYSFLEEPNPTQLNPYFYFHYAINQSMSAFEEVEEFSDVVDVFLEKRDAQVMVEMVGTNYGELVNLSPRLFEPYFGGQIEDSFKLTSELLDSFFTLYGHLKSGYKVHIPNTELEGDPFNSYELDGVIFDPSEKKLIVLETTFHSDIGHLDNKLATYMAFRNTDIDKFEYFLIHFNDLSGSQAKESTNRQALMGESFHVIKPEPSLTEVQNAYLTGDKVKNYKELQNSFQQSFEDVIEQLDSTLEQVAG